MNNVKKFFKSLRFRVFLLILIFGIAPSFVLRAGLLHAYTNRAVESRSQEVSEQAVLLVSAVAGCDYLEGEKSSSVTRQLEQFANIYDGRVMLADASFTVVEDTFGLDEGKSVLSEGAIRAYRGDTVSSTDTEAGYIELSMPVNDPETGEIEGVMLISISLDGIKTDASYMNQWGLLALLILILLIVIAAFIVTGYLVKPMKKLSTSIMDVKEGYEKDFIHVTTYTETEMISDACGDMLSRLQTLDDSRQQFVSNVSHELKTPLTSMKVLADSLTMQQGVPAELYREFMIDIGNEIDRENKIINDLLSLVKMGKQSDEFRAEPTNINELLELLMRRIRPIAEKKDVDLVLESFRTIVADVDEVKLTLALSNLIENAVKYNQPGGWVHVSLNADHQNFFVSVEDNGIGIPEEDQAHIFERFYRVDKSHSREIGGTGLGLAIARTAVIMHRGAIKVHSIPEQGTTFTVRIPLRYIDEKHKGISFEDMP